MGERGIIMTGASVREILSGSKTQTRRLLKPELQAQFDKVGEKLLKQFPRQHGTGWKVGDKLWVRETWQAWAEFDSASADMLPPEMRARINYPADGNTWDARKRSPIYMPRWASRLTLTVTDVRVERLQDISEEDAVAEGCKPSPFPGPWWQGYQRFEDELVHQQVVGAEPPEWIIEPHRMGATDYLNRSAIDAYRTLWNSIHGPDAWSANPWIAAISFTPHPTPAEAERS